jgi:hypothetical protein
MKLTVIQLVKISVILTYVKPESKIPYSQEFTI